MYFLYSFFMFLLLPLVYLRLLWKSRKLKDYRYRIAERFMLSTKPKADPIDVWVHAVSLGEVNAVSPLIEQMLDAGLSVLLTTMTPTGSQRALSLFSGRIAHQYLPYDLAFLQKRFLRVWQPRIAIVVETELWPNMIRAAHRQGIELFIVNARLSPDAFKGYSKFRFFFQPLLEKLSAVLTQSEEDSQRFMALGMSEAKVNTMGNLKFDMRFDSQLTEEFNQIKEQWGTERPVLILASSHEGEEKALIEQLPRLRQSLSDMLLLIAPRHPERFQTVYQLAQAMGFHVGLRSNPETLSTENDIIVLDSLGELMSWFQLSHYAIVGGSFVDVGGHNVLEPLSVSLPVIIGPIYYNFKAICHTLEQNHALLIAEHMEEAVQKIVSLHQNGEEKSQLIGNALTIINKNKGAVMRYFASVQAALARQMKDADS